MTDLRLYPLLLSASLHTKVWGGRKLEDIMHKNLPTDEPYGESWELHDTTTVMNGVFAGRTLGNLLKEYGAELVGEGNALADGFPLLAKFLDASDWLSIQVHPNDEQAAELEGEPRGKTEAWIFLYAEPDAKIVLGTKSGTTREAMAQAIFEGNLEDFIAYSDIEKGDAVLLRANTVHALGPGLLIYEIQQSSDTTYRLYDWNRMGLDGKPRDLHIEKGVQVSNLDYVPQVENNWHDAAPEITLVQCEYFQTHLHRLSHYDSSEVIMKTDGKFQALTCIQGEVQLESGGVYLTIVTGQTVLIPACIDTYVLSGNGEFLRSWQP